MSEDETAGRTEVDIIWNCFGLANRWARFSTYYSSDFSATGADGRMNVESMN